ncbi:MAG: ABC transporter substrate-binding protein [Pseudolabrys sp.]|nr:ABC transporter substrate-binding protein [Pseudolabrys sp.]
MPIGLKTALCAAAFASLALAPVPSFAQAASGEPIKIGALLSVTGGLAGVGQPERDGVLFAAKILNQRGGIKGRPVEILLEDDGSNPDAAISKANKLIHEQKVAAIIGPSGIAQSVAIGAITHPIKMPLVAFAGLGPEIERQRTCVFHLTPAQALNSHALLAYAKSIGAKNVGVLHDSGYGQVIWNVMQKMGTEFGITFSKVEKFDIVATDATAQAALIRSTAPDAVFVLSTSAVPFRALHQVRFGKPVISVHGTATYEYVKAMGDGANGVVHAEFLIAEDPLPSQKEFVALYEKEFGKKPKHFDAAGWDALNVVVKAINETGGTDGAKLCDAIRKPYDGVMTKYDFSQPDMGGLTPASFTYSVLEKGAFKRLPFKAAN